MFSFFSSLPVADEVLLVEPCLLGAQEGRVGAAALTEVEHLEKDVLTQGIVREGVNEKYKHICGHGPPPARHQNSSFSEHFSKN